MTTTELMSAIARKANILKIEELMKCILDMGD